MSSNPCQLHRLWGVVTIKR